MEHIEIYGVRHKIVGVKEDRVIFQAMEPHWRNKKSYKIKYDCYNGYYVNIPNKIIKMEEILKRWQLFKDIKDDIDYRNEKRGE